ncbi:MAG: two-component sensor histidine kinase, partial [Candidatus Methylumidiphilus sp.]
MSIRRTLLLFFLLIGLAPATLLTGLAFYKAKEALQLEITRNLKKEASSLMEAIGRMMFERVLQVHTWSHLELMQDVRVGDVDKRLSHLLFDLNRHYAGIYLNLTCSNRQGVIVAASKADLVGTKTEPRGFWQNAPLTQGEITLSTLEIDPKSNRVSIAMDAIIHNPHTNENVGKLHALFDWTDIFDLLDQNGKDAGNASSGSLAVLFDDLGRVIAASAPLRERGLLLSKALNPWRMLSGHGAIISNTKNLLGYGEVLAGSSSGYGRQGFLALGWSVQVYHPTAIAFAPVH